MPLHPQARAMIDRYGSSAALDYAHLTAAEFRNAFALPIPDPDPDGPVCIEDLVIAGNAGPLRLRLYRPKATAPLPITLYCHGGGFVIGSPEVTDNICRVLAEEAATLVISPAYRLAPEARFPAGIDDAYASLRFAHRCATELGGDGKRIAVAGDSSGGNFAAVLAQWAAVEGPRLCHQLLIYPVLDCNFATASYQDYAEGYLLSAAMMRWFWEQYLPGPALATDWRASPLRQTRLEGLPSASILTAEYDVLRDEAESYAAALRKAGVRVELNRWPGQIHGFLREPETVDDAPRALAELAQSLRLSFAEAAISS